MCSLMETNATLEEELQRRLQSDMSKLELITEPSARALFHCLYELDGSLFSCYSQAEPSPLVSYMLRLVGCVGSAVSELNVKNEPDQQIALNRLLLFVAARNVIAEGMELLGMKPLSRI